MSELLRKVARGWSIVCLVTVMSPLAGMGQETPAVQGGGTPPVQDTPSLTAEDATFSVEVSAVNSVPLPGGPTGQLTVHPGDVLTVEILVRNWSRHGDTLRAFQATVDENGFTTGASGTIRPVDYDETTGKGVENKAHCSVDTARRDYVFKELQNFGVTDSVSPGYRWMGAVLNPDDSPTHPQDGGKRYCGTMRMKVSDDARGSFTIGLIEEEWGSTLRTPANLEVLGLSFERLVVTVEQDALRVVSAEPAVEAVDARWLKAPRGSANAGWDSITLTFNHEPRNLSPADLEIVDATDAPPRIKEIRVVGATATLRLDRSVRLRHWTTVTHKPSGTGTRFGFLPGDVDANGIVDTNDLLRLVEPKDSLPALAVYQCDIDGDGVCGPKDALREIDLFGQPDAYRAKLNSRVGR